MSKVLKTVRKVENIFTKDKAKTLTCVNAVGVVATAGISMRAGMNIQKKIDNGDLTKADIFKNVVPMAASVLITEAAGIGSYKQSTKTIAELTLGLTSAKKEYEALEQKMKESLGDEKTKEIQKEAMKEVANDKTTTNDSVMPDITGYFWWKDVFSGAYFYCKESDILNAWTKAAKKLYVGEKVYLADFYYDLERRDQMYESYSMAKEFGWNGLDSLQRGCRIVLTGTEELPNGAPCRAIRYSDTPKVL